MVRFTSWFVTGTRSKTILHPPPKKKILGILRLYWHIEINLNAKRLLKSEYDSFNSLSIRSCNKNQSPPNI